MLTTPSALMEFLSGTFEKEITFAASKGSSGGFIQSVRKYTSPFNPNTPAQVQVRSAFSKASEFFFNAQDKTIGGSSFNREDFLDTVADKAKKLEYRGIPTIGNTAGRQTFIMAAMVQMSEAGIWTSLDVLPQNMTTEAQLDTLLEFINNAFKTVKNRKQRQRVGYIG